jgi:hypothetical protein
MSKKCLNGFEMSKAESLIVEFFNNADSVQVEEGTWYYSESSVNSELLEVYIQLAKANERVRELEKELTLSTDQNDLLLDEFIRVKHLTDNTEIQGLCERAHVRMRQNVSVIDRNHKLVREVAELKNKVNSLENSDGGLLLKALFYAPSSPVSPSKAEEIEAWYEKVKQLRKEKD